MFCSGTLRRAFRVRLLSIGAQITLFLIFPGRGWGGTFLGEDGDCSLKQMAMTKLCGHTGRFIRLKSRFPSRDISPSIVNRKTSRNVVKQPNKVHFEGTFVTCLPAMRPYNTAEIVQQRVLSKLSYGLVQSETQYDRYFM